jgi:hypothetical protein
MLRPRHRREKQPGAPSRPDPRRARRLLPPGQPLPLRPLPLPVAGLRSHTRDSARHAPPSPFSLVRATAGMRPPVRARDRGGLRTGSKGLELRRAGESLAVLLLPWWPSTPSSFS